MTVLTGKSADGEEEQQEQEQEQEEQLESLSKKQKKRRKDAAAGKSLLEDDRFAAMWSDPRFEIDVESADYKQLHPSGRDSSKHPNEEPEDLLEEHFEDVEYSDGDNDDGAHGASAEVRSGQRRDRKRKKPYCYEDDDAWHRKYG